MPKEKDPEPKGLDLVNDKPDYTKTWEENQKKYDQEFNKIYGDKGKK